MRKEDEGGRMDAACRNEGGEGRGRKEGFWVREDNGKKGEGE